MAVFTLNNHPFALIFAKKNGFAMEFFSDASIGKPADNRGVYLIENARIFTTPNLNRCRAITPAKRPLKVPDFAPIFAGY
ncbi:MAG: hypothetical protein WCP36_00005 [Methanomicrobiales archaeon]